MILMTPEPRFSKLARRKGRAVTIIAGFRCKEGVVICSNTQETIASAKRNVPKLRFEPSDKILETEESAANLAAAFCGSGSGPMIDKLIDEAWGAARNAESLEAACKAIEASIVEQYKRFGQVFQKGACPEVQLIYGVKMNGVGRLFSAWGPIVNEKFDFDSGGEGHYMADFLASKLHHDSLTMTQCVILAAYVLYEAKEHVEGCGGDSQIAVLRNSGHSGTVSYSSAIPLTEFINSVDSTTGSMLMCFADVEQSKDDLAFRVDEHLKHLVQERWLLLDRFRRHGEYHVDHLGIPTEGNVAHRNKRLPVFPAEEKASWLGWLEAYEARLNADSKLSTPETSEDQQ